MILDTSPEILHEEIGMHGIEIWWMPDHLRGIHIQEIQDCCMRRRHCIYPIEKNPHLCPEGDFEPKSIWTGNLKGKLLNAIACKRAILITPNHAVAWDGSDVYDPKGFIKSFDDYEIQEAWVLGQI